ncbi:zinc ribbon domain-containing protein [Streptomyces aureus]
MRGPALPIAGSSKRRLKPEKPAATKLGAAQASQARFTCRNCWVVTHADRNASHNIARKGDAVWTAGRESRVPATP